MRTDDDDATHGIDTGTDSPLRDADPLLWAAGRAVETAEAYPFSALAGDATGPTVMLGHLKALAKLFRREHPADDGEPITAEWVVAVLPATSERGRRGERSGRFGSVAWWTVGDVPGGIVVWLNGVKLPLSTMTRGRFRRLLAALGIDATRTQEGER